MRKTLSSLFGSVLTLVCWQTASGQFVAFNDFYRGPETHTNTTEWNGYGSAGATGPLKDMTTGLNLPVTLTITNGSAVEAGLASKPNTETPAYNVFNTPVNYVDWATATSGNNAIQLAGTTPMGETITGLNPNRRYRLTVTATRGGSYADRWTTYDLVGTAFYTPAHSSGCLTNGSAGVPSGNITPSQAVINTGHNLAGDIASWDNIDPGPDGTIAVLAWTYRGTVPGGSSAGSYGYGIHGLKLEEFNPNPYPVYLVIQPQSIAVNELQPAIFTALATGNPTPTYQWMRIDAGVTNLIPGATDYSYTNEFPSANESGAQFFVRCQNTVGGTLNTVDSSNATLTVIPDTNSPVLLGAFSSSTMTNVTVNFSEGISAETGTNLANYLLTNSATGVVVPISKAVMQPGFSNVVLTTARMSNGVYYTLVVSGIRDRATAANLMPLSTATFYAQSLFTVTSIGGATPQGSWLPAGNGGSLSGGGSDIGLTSTSDSFQLAYQTRSGDFDLAVRVLSFSLSDPWAKAGLMARAMPLSANGMYAAALATPGLNGCIFQARTAPGAAATSSGSFPVNHPYTWLRLQRTNMTNFISYAGVDGNSWSILGRAVINMLDPIAVGLALSSHANGVSATVQFRDYLPPSGTESLDLNVEPLSASSRKTAFAISEIMYNPGRLALGLPESNSLEFIEIYNSQPFFEDMSGYRISGSVHFIFPSNTVMQAGSFLLVARDPDFLRTYYGLSTVNVLGPWFSSAEAEQGTNFANNSLPGDSGTVRLRNKQGAVLLEVNYRTKDPWPVAPDGAGHSLVLARPSYGEGDPRAWAPSGNFGGSPGRVDPIASDRLRNVVINEFLANTANTAWEDFIELYNHGNQPVNLSGAWLSDDPAISKFRIPAGTLLAATSSVSFVRSTLGFGLDADGGRIFLVNSNADQVIDCLRYEGQAKGVSSGRWPDGAPGFRPLTALTPDGPNAAFVLGDIVINELMYSPISGRSDEEYIELYNKGTNDVNLRGWKFGDGIDLTFTNNTIIPANGYLVVGKNKSILRAKYNNLNDTNTVGNYSGTLANGGERITLERPEYTYTTNGSIITTTVVYYVENELTYGDGGRWGNWSDGGGSSLELVDPHSDNRLPSNWADSDETQKSIWTSIDFTGPVGETLGSPISDNVLICQLGIGECLVDDVQVISGGNNLLVDGSFESGLTNWVPQGSHDLSTVEVGGTVGSHSLHLRAGSRGDNGGNRVRSTPNWGAISGTVTLHAQVRWLKGWPEFLLRLHGGGAEAYGALHLPNNLGTPGARNSRAVSNAGPGIWDVTHTPICPIPNEPVRITARAFDPDGISSLNVRYRLDPAPDYLSVSLVDDGTGGDAVALDGVYTATLLGQNTGAIVAFYIEAVDAGNATNLFPQDVFPTPPLARVFPNDCPLRECVVRWGEIQMPGSFATYHLWLTTVNRDRWRDRDHLNNSTMDGTFVYNNCRVIYNSLPNFAGSPWHRGQMTSGPDGSQRVDYVQSFPSDDRFLGATDSVLCNPGNPGGIDTSDKSAQSEQSSYLIFNGIGVHYNYRRYIHHFVNGTQRSRVSGRSGNFIFEDSQQPNADVVNQWFPDDTDGELLKIEDWFEFNDNGYDFSSNNDADVTRRTIVVNGQTNLYIAPYRFMFRRRAYGPGDSVNDYQNFWKIVDAASPASNPNAGTIPNPSALDAIINAEQWLRIFACQHAVGNWDAYGFSRGKNDYMYKPVRGRFEQMTWDIDFTMGVGGNAATDPIDTGISDPRMAAFMHTPVFSRAYLRAFEDMVNGPLNNSYIDPILDAKHAALLANNVDVDVGTVNTIKTYTGARRTSILSQISVATSAPFAVFTPSSFETNGNWVTITGSAPVRVKTIKINGSEYPITWTASSVWTPTNWAIQLYLGLGTNFYSIQGYDLQGNAVAGASANLAINYTGPGESPLDAIVLSEIMYNPTNPAAEYVEIFNTSSNFTFDISGWRINGLGEYTFPGGTLITNRQYLVLARDRAAFATAYGSTLPVFDVFDGNLDTDGETLTLIKPAVTTNQVDIAIDRVRYGARPPWPVVTSGTSIQLVDSAQDNSRVGNWAGGAQWRFFTARGNPGTNRVLYLYPDVNGCDLFLDDIRLELGTNALAGTNLLVNGDFELGTNGWVIKQPPPSGSGVTNLVSHSGSSSVRVVVNAGSGGNANSSGLNQAITSGFVPNTTYTLSYWYLSNFKGSNLWSQMGLLIPRFRSTNSNIGGVPYTPGAANSVATVLPEFPPIWLNEVQPVNVNTLTNRLGQFAPWVELFNPTTNQVDLTGLFLANNYSSNMLQWAFPTGSVINAGEFKIIWLDAAESNSTPEELHANFTIPPLAGSIALTRPFNNQAQVVDYLNYYGLGASLSYGDYPDGQPFSRQIFFNATPGGANDPQHGLLFVNEWVASNVQLATNGIGGIPNPVGGGYDDWFEIYNPNPYPVNLNNYFLTDTNGNPGQYKIPAGYIVPANGFLVVWADGNPGRNSPTNAELHVSFQLGREGEQIGLYDPNTNLIDLVSFGPQTNNISQGRYGDGASEPFYYMPNPSPGSNNYLLVNLPPVFQTSIPDLVVTQRQVLFVTNVATDPNMPPQSLTYRLGPNSPAGASVNAVSGLFTWVTMTNAAGPYVITVRVEDNGLPRLSATNRFNVTLVPTNTTPANSPPELQPVSNYVIRVNQMLCVTNVATDPDVPAQTLTFSLDRKPEGASIDGQTGIFRWKPQCWQGSSSNFVTVRVTDNGLPTNLSDTTSFIVWVYECVEASLGRTVTLAGESNSVSMILNSTVELTNLSFGVACDPARIFTNFWVKVDTNLVPVPFCTNLPDGQFAIRFDLPADRVLHGPTNVGDLWFDSAASQTSAFVILNVTNVSGSKPDGNPVINAYGYPGRVVLIGTQPLLEALYATNGQAVFMLYAQPGTTNHLQSSADFTQVNSWQDVVNPVPEVTTNRFQVLAPIPATNATMFYRAVRR